MLDYYQILETSVNASPAEIREQYRFLLHAWHPDKFPTPADKAKAQEKTRLINEAYAVLSDPHKRERYNRTYRGPAQRTVRAGSPANPVDSFEWLLHFKPDHAYSIWLDPGFNPYEWEEGSTPEIQREWHGDEYQLCVPHPGKTAIASFAQVLSDILIAVQVRFLPGSSDTGEAGILLGIGYAHYIPTRYFRFALARTGAWKFSYLDRALGETVFREGVSADARRHCFAAEPVRLVAASFEDTLLLGIDQQSLGEMIHIPQPACGTVGVFVSCPAQAPFCGAAFSNFRPYFIKQS